MDKRCIIKEYDEDEEELEGAFDYPFEFMIPSELKPSLTREIKEVDRRIV